MTGSVLTAKQRKLGVHAQVQALVRIARRAEANADWLDELLAGGRTFDGPADVVNTRAKRDAKRARALAASDELVRIVRDNPDAGWTRAQSAAASSWEIER